MSSKRLAKLEQEFRVVSEQISSSVNPADVVQLEKHRESILIEAREIARKLNLPEPNWVRKKI
jgi:effector-associated domain 9 (EAD9)-containing protein